MSIGRLSEFDVKSGQWSSYVDRLDMYFKVNGVKDELKLATLIATMGDEAYELLVNLASPKKPSELTYSGAIELMQEHLQPTPSSLAERYRFRQKRQGQGEDVASYVAELKKLARHCKFAANLNENLRDQFVCGLRSDVIRQRLFAEEDSITFVNAVKLASSLEAAERDAAIVEGPSTANLGDKSSTSDLHALTAGVGRGGRPHAGSRPRQASTSGPRTSGSMNCAACGATTHSFNSCRFREYKCSRCQCTGHLRRVCPEYQGQSSRRGPSRNHGGQRQGIYFGDTGNGHESSGENVDDLEVNLNLIGLNNYKPVSLPICIDGKVLNMEVDTGTAISCINKSTYKQYFSHLCIEADDTILRFYDGTKVKPLGIIRPRIRYLDKEKQLELFVINNGSTSLIGRQWLAELEIDIPRLNCVKSNAVNFVSVNEDLHNMLIRYKELFSGGLGRYTGGRATLRVREGAAPAFHRARPLPYALRERVDAELDAMLRDGVIEPVDCSDWASPLVPVTKADGTLRICADYKMTLNPVLLIDRYPLPRIEDVLVGLDGAQFFSKIDLSQAYNQVELDESKRYTVINTHRGLFQYNRLVYGLSSSVGIFQRIMTTLLGNIPNVQVFLDDVIIGGKTESEHLRALELVFQRLSDNGLKLKRQKCVFLVDEVTYLGYVVSREGIKTDKSKIEAISKIQTPENVSELRSFIGMVNFFSKFIRNFSSLVVPLNNLLRKGIEWNWDKQCGYAFLEIKRALMSTGILAHYDPTKPLVVTCDASPRGVGGVLAQPGPGGERPVAYASRSLIPAEKNYSQIHREALAIIFCMRKFHQYIYGRKFTLRTDHKPLVSILGPHSGIPTMTASRMQRWAVILSAYNYDIEYIKSNDNCADGLSRLPDNSNAANGAEASIPEQTYLHYAQDGLLLEYSTIKQQTEKDPVLGRILNYVREGWPEKAEIDNLLPYYNRKTELYEELGVVMWGHRVVVPEACRETVLRLIHEPHMGIVKSKALARSYVWWPGLDEAVERECRTCAVCAAQADAPPRAPPRPWAWPARPWSRLHLDFMGPIAGKTYLVIIDATSKWLEVFRVPSTAAGYTTARLGELWSRWGIPRQVVTDNGPPFTSTEFAQFIEKDGIQHIFTAPYHPSSNGAAENAVKTLKRVIKKAHTENKDVEKSLNTFLLYYRNTEHCTTGASPSCILIGRRLRTRLDALKPNLEHRVQKAQERQIRESGGMEREIKVGDDVWYRQFLKGEKWLPGTIVNSAGPSNFKVIDGSGKNSHRHIDQLRRRTGSSLAIPTGSVARDSTLESPVAGSAEVQAERTAVPATPAATAAPSAATASQPTGGVDGSDDDPDGDEFRTPPPAPVPPRLRPVRLCRLSKNINYKI